MTVGPMKPVSWHRDMLPAFLWLAAMLGRRSDWRAAYRALDVVDRFVPDGERFVDGRLSTFAFVPEDQREAARAALAGEAPHALPSALGAALSFYPDCPALWLYEDRATDRIPREEALGLLRSLIVEHADKTSVASTRVRMAAISRRVTHGKLSHSGVGALALVPRYPDRLSGEEQRQVESTMRAAWNAMFGSEVERWPQVLEWPRAFWIRGRDLVPCETRIDRNEDSPDEQDGPLDPEPLMRVSEMRAILTALDALGAELSELERDLSVDPGVDESNAVLLGLASRLYRLLYAIAERPSAWVPDTAALLLRPIVDTRILCGWLLHRNDPSLFAAYQEHGRGRLKLLREHVREDAGDSPDEGARELLEHFDRRVNLEVDEMFQPVNLGAFTKASQRDMAIEAGLKREYDLSYAPLSSANHGEWPAVRENDTVLCVEPLHGAHRLGRFARPSRAVQPEPVLTALHLVRGGISEVFDHYGRDVRASFEPVRQALEHAVYEQGNAD
jgi:hypothetical protein